MTDRDDRADAGSPGGEIARRAAGSAEARSGWWRWSGLLCAMLGVLGHAPALFNGFVLDDDDLLTDNPQLRDLDGLWTMLRSGLFEAVVDARTAPYYRPASSVLYWVSYQLLGISALLHHALNLVLHGMVAWLAHRAMLALGLGLTTALGCAALFAVHPATADIVAYIGGRQDMLGWMAVLAAVPPLTRATGFGRPMALASVSVFVAATSREFFLCSPALLVAAGLAQTAPRRPVVGILSGGALAIGAVLGIRSWIGLPGAGTWPLDALLRAIAGVFLRLVRDVVWPTDLVVDVTPPLPPTWVATVIVVALGAFAVGAGIAAVRGGTPGRSAACFATWTVVLSAVLHAPVVVIMGFLSDRYAYGVVLAVPVLAGLLVERWMRERRVRGHHGRPGLVVTAAIAVPVVCLIPLTWARDVDHRSDEMLQLALYRDRPDDPQAWLAEGMRRWFAGDLDGAAPLCERYVATVAGAGEAVWCLASWHAAHGRPERAAELVAPYVWGHPVLIRPRVLLLESFFKSGNLAAVEQALDRLQPMFPDARDLREARRALEAVRQQRATRSPGRSGMQSR